MSAATLQIQLNQDRIAQEARGVDRSIHVQYSRTPPQKRALSGARPSIAHAPDISRAAVPCQNRRSLPA